MQEDIDRLNYTNRILAEACTTHRSKIADLEDENASLKKSLKKYKTAKDIIFIIGGVFALIELYPF